MKSHAQTRTRLSSGWVFVVAQFLPMAILWIAYLSSSDRIDTVVVSGVQLGQLLLASAVLTPIVSQALSGPLFRGLEHHGWPTDMAGVAGSVLRHMPRSYAVALLPVVLVTAWSGRALQLSGGGVLMLVLIVLLHVLFAGSLVPAYRLRSSWLLVLGWSAYALALVAAPQLWWLPSTVGLLVEVAILVVVGRHRWSGAPSVASWTDLTVSMFRLTAVAMPLWCLPLGVYIASAGDIAPMLVFVGLVPALVAYQVYFVVVAARTWTSLEDARASLAERPYREAREHLQEIAGHLVAGLRRITVVLFLVVAAASFVVTRVPTERLFLCAMMGCAAISFALIAELTRLSMVRESSAASVVGAVGAVLLAAALLLGATPYQVLLGHAVVCTSAWVWARVLNRSAWRTPEYHMFWSAALRA